MYNRKNESIIHLVIITFFLLDVCVAELQLKMLNVVFRHGDRTPTEKSSYANDPYTKHDFYPYGYGALTNSGKLRAYKLGEFLHERYKNFLGDVYLPELLYARSTDYERTKMSLQLVLAGLFPPTNVQKWHNTLNWQPIPITYKAKPDDLLGTIHLPRYQIERRRVENEREIKEELGNLRPFMSELSDLTGNYINNTLDVKNIYDTLVSESFMNLTLPDWTKEMFPHGKLLEAALFDYDICSYDNNITRALVGKLMAKISRDILTIKDDKIYDKAEDEIAKKIFLYSGHEINVVGVLRSLKVFKTHEPQYSSAVIIELFEENAKYFIKVVYYQGITSTATELQMPGCSDILCPLEKYLAIINEVSEY
ncbi:hypothetical protein TSAR_015564 [Trichomalopsis sarcophagae]|uniref:acid phosphatase n=1 Tax=Trichomalopsis sarcophagae TaxID=543379 RepID=A0A232EYU6_9HYME|nr:hypothetical protein TSAR_015564 [Trichomalopsis sarcophagae]